MWIPFQLNLFEAGGFADFWRGAFFGRGAKVLQERMGGGVTVAPVESQVGVESKIRVGRWVMRFMVRLSAKWN